MTPFASRDPHPTDDPQGLWQSWSRLEILGLFFMVLAGNTFFQIVAYSSTQMIFAAVSAGAVLGVFLPLWMVSRLRKLQVKRDFALDQPPLPLLLAAAVMALVALVPTSLLAELSIRLWPADPESVALYNQNLPVSWGGRALVFVAVVILGPLAEELTYRGILHRLAGGIWGSWHGAAVSSLVFGIVHMQPWLLFGLVGVGLVLAFVYEATGSITACWVTHAVHNGVSLVLMLQRGGVSSQPSDLGWADAAWGVGSVAAMVLVGLYMVRYRRAGWRR